jgi:drug/metabolite transporter (DMT)-like permease
MLGTGIGWLMRLYALHWLPAGTASLNSLAMPVGVIVLGLAHMPAVAVRKQRRADPAKARE